MSCFLKAYSTKKLSDHTGGYFYVQNYPLACSHFTKGKSQQTFLKFTTIVVCIMVIFNYLLILAEDLNTYL